MAAGSVGPVTNRHASSSDAHASQSGRSSSTGLSVSYHRPHSQPHWCPWSHQYDAQAEKVLALVCLTPRQILQTQKLR